MDTCLWACMVMLGISLKFYPFSLPDFPTPFWPYTVSSSTSNRLQRMFAPCAYFTIRVCHLLCVCVCVSVCVCVPRRYTQHRAMHDVKFLWEYGHQYHHQWKRTEHMIGITNFSFDAIVEGWVTMSSAFAPVSFSLRKAALVAQINHSVTLITKLKLYRHKLKQDSKQKSVICFLFLFSF